ncbi:hypothetical protein BD410DRAFT_792222 [Rickenella mellea]|uniref:Uncharacterized protein n=1 Tax=Rickenella mellea TaxID=50990 RepID=A0A4Y7PWX3_9AGAM|nr:hypothetical protein BD410DRAFT_792222 [Rickenella mellea]
MTIFLPGTCSFADAFRYSSLSRIWDLNKWHLIASTGEFHNQTSQEQYIIPYVWLDVERKDEMSHEHKPVLDLAWQWLRVSS